MRKMLLSMFVGVTALAAPRILTLSEAEKLAVERSPRLKSSAQDANAAHSGADSSYARLFPRLSLDATAKYVSQIPTISLGPNTVRFGDNWNYSIGPSLTYTLFDGGASRDVWKSLEKIAEGRDEDKRLAKRQLLAATRIAYAQAQISRQELSLVDHSLALASAQQKDIARRFRTGAASRLDYVGANREVSNYEVRLANSKAEWKATLEELASYVGDVTSETEFDPLDVSAVAVSEKGLNDPDGSHPQLKAQEKVLRGAELAADGQSDLRWPTLVLQARTSLDYPNGPILERINQNSISLGLSFPLFDWGQIGGVAEQKRAEALSASYRREQTQSDLNRDWQKARARLNGLLEQRTSAIKSVTESEEIARLSYQSYRAGQLNLLDVQTMNLRLLEAQVQKARIDGQLLVQFAILRSLSASEESP